MLGDAQLELCREAVAAMLRWLKARWICTAAHPTGGVTTSKGCPAGHPTGCHQAQLSGMGTTGVSSQIMQGNCGILLIHRCSVRKAVPVLQEMIFKEKLLKDLYDLHERGGNFD